MRHVRNAMWDAIYTYAFIQAFRGLWSFFRDAAYALNERYATK